MGIISLRSASHTQIILKKRYNGTMDFELLNAVANLETPEGVIALPGPDGYALAARLDRPKALSRIVRITGGKDAMLLLGRDINAFTPYVESIPVKAFDLMSRHWPGALMILLHKGTNLPDSVTSQAQVSLMQPANPLLLDLLSLIPGGILAVSCSGRQGEKAPFKALEVFNTFGDDVDFVLQNDALCLESAPPTMVSVKPDGSVHLLRRGPVVLD